MRGALESFISVTLFSLILDGELRMSASRDVLSGAPLGGFGGLFIFGIPREEGGGGADEIGSTFGDLKRSSILAYITNFPGYLLTRLHSNLV